MLGDDWEDKHRTWLHRLGNLTLTAYNSSYSNRPFLEKKTIEGGFEQSSVRPERVREESDAVDCYPDGRTRMAPGNAGG